MRVSDVTASSNGWPGLPDGSSALATGTIPGTTRRVTLARAALPLFLHFCAAWHAEMPARLKLDKGPVDGWEYREQRSGGGVLSNHASGTAVDLRYDVLPADQRRHMTDAELTILKGILRRYATADGHLVLANGWSWNAKDEMHTELSQGWEWGAKRDTTPADVREVIVRLGIRPDGTVAPTVGHAVRRIKVTGSGRLSASQIAALLGTSARRIVLRNAWLLTRRARRGDMIRVPADVPIRPLDSTGR